MRMFALDDCGISLELLTLAIKAAAPDAEVFPFDKPTELIEFARETQSDIAFLDVEMQGMNGLEVAKRLKDMNPRTNIIFVTAHSKYALDSLSLYPSGYVLKPVTKEAVEREIENLRHPVEKIAGAKIRVQTFGNFDVFVDDKPLAFSRSKAKELFAYLVDRQGTSATTAEIAGILWEDRDYDRSLQSQTQVVIASMMKSLKEHGIEDVVIKGRNQTAVDRTKIKCDYYDFLEWDIAAVNAYNGEYMLNYTWAEMTAGAIEQKLQDR